MVCLTTLIPQSRRSRDETGITIWQQSVGIGVVNRRRSVRGFLAELGETPTVVLLLFSMKVKMWCIFTESYDSTNWTCSNPFSVVLIQTMRPAHPSKEKLISRIQPERKKTTELRSRRTSPASVTTQIKEKVLYNCFERPNAE